VKSRRPFPWLGLAVVAAMLACSGCERFFDKGSRQDIAAGDEKAAAGEFRLALRQYEASLDGTEQTAEVHYKMAMIYATKLNSPLDAMHHFGRYLELAPNGPHAKEARDYQAEGDRQLVVDLSRGSPLTLEEAVRLKNENMELMSKLAALRAQKGFRGGKPGSPGSGPIPGSTNYVVQPGDTLASIAQKQYKNKARWKDIQEANFGSTEGTAKIKPGSTLVIPP